jgi:WD40 repeat protein
MPGEGLHTQESPLGTDSEKPNATWQPSPRWAQRYSNVRGDALAEEFERTRRYIVDSRDEERRLREAEQRRLEEQAEAERKRADHERQLANEARMSARRARRFAVIAALVALLALGLAYVAYTFQQQAQTAQQQAQTAQQQAQTAEQHRTLDLFESQLTHGGLLARVEDYAEARRVLAESARLDADIPETRRHARNLLAGFVETMGGKAKQAYVGAGAALVGGVTVSPDGKLLAAAGERGTLVLFDADSGKQFKRLEGHDAKAGELGAVHSMAFDPLGRWLFSGGEDGRIIRWSLPAGEKLGEWKAPDAVIALALSPDGKTLASGSPDGQIILWDVAGGKTLRTLKGHTKRIAGSSKGLAFSADGEWLASASWDKTARIWDVKTGKKSHVLDWHNEPVMAVAFSPDNELLATSSYDTRVVLWKTQTGERVRVMVGHKNIVFGVAFSADGRHLYSASRDNTLRQWNVASGITRRVYQGHEAALWSVALHGDRLYTAATDGTVRRWSPATPEQWMWDMSEEPDSVAISPDANLITAGFKSGTLCLYNRASGQELARIDNAHSSRITSVAFDPTGTQIATAGFDDKTAKIWRLERTDSGLRLIPVHTLQGHTGAVYRVAFSLDGRRLATAGYDGQIGLFEVADGKGRLFPAHEAQVHSVAFNPQGDRLLSAGEDGRLRLWNLDDPSQPPLEIAQTQDKLQWASLSPDGREVAAVGRDQTVFLYNFAKTDARRLVGHEQTVFRAIYSPNGCQLATVSADMTVRLWDVDSQRLLFSMRLPTEMQSPSPLWDFDFRCAAGDCWIAVPLTIGRLMLYRLPYEHPPAALAPPARSGGG